MFSTVESLYRYSGNHRDLLLRAKEVQDPLAVSIFFEVYSPLVRRVLIDIIVRHEISLIVLPRLSLRRVVGLQWHPVDFWLAHLREISQEHAEIGRYTVFMQPPFPSKRRAKIASALRRLHMGSQSFNTTSRANEGDCDHSINADSGCASVLFLDDVLTSGGTLLREFRFVSDRVNDKNFYLRSPANRMANFLQSGLKAHILTLFRTPVAENPKDERS